MIASNFMKLTLAGEIQIQKTERRRAAEKAAESDLA
jgi:hypothetical protein